jgi:kynurenine formamidase
MKLIDLSHPLVHGQAAFPGDPPLIVQPRGTVATTQFNTTQITMGTHQGTHLDAMYHFLEDGKTVDQMPLEWFYGPAHLLRVPKQAGAEITPEDLRPFEQHLQPEAKVLLATGWLEIHHVLQARDVEIVLVEALANLDALPDEFTFIGFPLNFQGRDGSPIRAIALC